MGTVILSSSGVEGGTLALVTDAGASITVGRQGGFGTSTKAKRCVPLPSTNTRGVVLPSSRRSSRADWTCICGFRQKRRPF